MSDAPNEVPTVFLAVPHYGGVSMGLHNTLNSAVRDRSLIQVVKEGQSSSSILPHAFNELFAIALDLRDRGEITHMAMVHSDILAERGWLDTLWSEMWFGKADLVSAVVPIKADNGRTSTAIGLESDPWAVPRCIWMKDREKIRPTFGAEDVCGPGEVLLVNTGLMLLDLRRSYWDDFAFQFHNRITKTPSGRIAGCRSEDWEMSHYLHKNKARYLATWKPRLRHEGGKKYPNYPES